MLVCFVPHVKRARTTPSPFRFFVARAINNKKQTNNEYILFVNRARARARGCVFSPLLGRSFRFSPSGSHFLQCGKPVSNFSASRRSRCGTFSSGSYRRRSNRISFEFATLSRSSQENRRTVQTIVSHRAATNYTADSSLRHRRLRP